jgi:hypothetical protein
MLTTDKNEIIGSICKDLEEASDSALTQLAKTFGVPLQDESEFIGTKSHPMLNSTRVTAAGEQSFWFTRDMEQTVYVRVPVVKHGKRLDGKTVIVKGVLVQNNEHLGKVVCALNNNSHLFGRRNNKNRHLSLLNDRKVSKTLRGRKVKLVGTFNIRKREVYSVEYEDDI